MREQHPQVLQRTDRKGGYWFFRYWHEELLPDGSINTTRRFHTIGPSKGQGALTQLEAEAQRDRVLGGVNATPTPTEAAVQAQEPTGAIPFGKLAEMWRKDYVEIPRSGWPNRRASSIARACDTTSCRAGGSSASDRCDQKRS